MFIRRTTITSRESGEPYYTYRLVESVRSGGRVRQHTVLNLGRNLGSAHDTENIVRYVPDCQPRDSDVALDASHTAGSPSHGVFFRSAV